MNAQISNIVEASLFAAGESLTINELQNLFSDDDRPDKHRIKECLDALQQAYEEKPIELIETASGYRFQVKIKYATWVSRLWEEKPVKYGRALLETLAIIAYQQPATRGEIEEIRGVSVSTNVIRTLLEREWVKVIGHKDVPGRPALYATTKEFLDYFSLQTLADLPPLASMQNIDVLASADIQLKLGDELVADDKQHDEKE